MSALGLRVAHDEDVGQRADVVLGRRLRGLSRRVAKQLSLAGGLRIDGAPAPPSTRVALGQHLELSTPATSTAAATPVRLLAVTPSFVYVDKPAGTHTHRLSPAEPAALADGVAERFPECRDASDDSRELGAIHRLDRDTSGVVAFARTRDAWIRGRTDLGRDTTVKLYVAVCTAPWPVPWPPTTDYGHPAPRFDIWPADLARPPSCDPWWLDAPLGHGSRRSRVMVRPDGRPARSTIAPVASASAEPGRARVAMAVRLHTGVRHQARAHLALVGTPILGDLTYGLTYGEKGEAMCLHCSVLELSSLAEPRVHAPLPTHITAELARWPFAPWAGLGPS